MATDSLCFCFYFCNIHFNFGFGNTIVFQNTFVTYRGSQCHIPPTIIFLSGNGITCYPLHPFYIFLQDTMIECSSSGSFIFSVQR